nr:PTS glucose transporter subunit IIA [Saccharibacillus sp. O23]
MASAAANVSAPALSGSENSAASVQPSGRLEIQAPLTGIAVPLSEVPDPAFAEGHMGRGIAILPTEGRVVAPFDGTVAHVMDKSRHALILEHAGGTQVLIHVGVDTVSLKGRGFTARVASGDAVKAGETLLEFDLNVIAAAGLSPITPVLIPDGLDTVLEVEPLAGGEVRAGQQPVLAVSFSSALSA